jgi:RNA polymerase sigma-70 factor, ECF subfamily
VDVLRFPTVPRPAAEEDTAAYVRQLTNCQSQLYAYIVTVLGRVQGADDILQETNLVLWHKSAEFDHDRPFLAWAFGCARMQVMAWRKRQACSRLVFDDSLFELLAEQQEERASEAEFEREALERCLEKLTPGHRELIDCCYQREESVQGIAAKLGRTANVVSVTLHRIRRILLTCVQSRLGRSAS